jgi:hypothetical protein
MSLSRKHYRAIADALVITQKRIEQGHVEPLGDLISELIVMFKQDNSRFDSATFKQYINNKQEESK